MTELALFNWSGGKDSALALYHTLRNSQFEVKHLLTSVNSETKWLVVFCMFGNNSLVKMQGKTNENYRKH